MHMMPCMYPTSLSVRLQYLLLEFSLSFLSSLYFIFLIASGLSYACVFWLIFFRNTPPAGELMYSLTTCNSTDTRGCPYFFPRTYI